MRVHGSRGWRRVCCGVGSRSPAASSRSRSVGRRRSCGRRRRTRSRATTFLCLALIARTLGSSTAAAEQATAQIERDRSYFRDLVQHAADVIALVSPDFQIDYISPGIEPLVGRRAARRASASTSATCSASDAADDIARAYDTLTLSDYVACEWHLTNEFHEQRRAYARLTRRHDGSLVLNLRDVTEQRALEAQLEHRASVDALTGCPTAAALMQQLAQLGVGRRHHGAVHRPRRVQGGQRRARSRVGRRRAPRRRAPDRVRRARRRVASAAWAATSSSRSCRAPTRRRALAVGRRLHRRHRGRSARR